MFSATATRISREEKIQERLRDATDFKHGPPAIYPLVLYSTEEERDECHSIFQRVVPDHIAEAMADLALLEEVAEPSFL
jgi:hypothetical protein